MSHELQSFFNAINKCIHNKNGRELSEHVQLPLRGVKLSSIKRQLAERLKSGVITSCSMGISDQHIGKIVGLYLSALKALVVESDIQVAYDYEHDAYNHTIDFFSLRDDTYPDTTWIIPVVDRISNDLRIIAEMVIYYLHFSFLVLLY